MNNNDVKAFTEGYILGRRTPQTTPQILIPSVDALPTWVEIIIDNEWSVKLKISDELYEGECELIFTSDYREIPYLKNRTKNDKLYTCIYKGDTLLWYSEQWVGGYTISQAWSYTMDRSDHPWLNVYYGHKYGNASSVTATKDTYTSFIDGHSMANLQIYVYAPITWFTYRYNIDGEIEYEEQSQTDSNYRQYLYVSCNHYDCAADPNYNNNIKNLIDFSQAVYRCQEFQYII